MSLPQIYRLDGVTLPDPDPSKLFAVDEMDRAIGGIPGWAALVDPDYADFTVPTDPTPVLNRVTGSNNNSQTGLSSEEIEGRLLFKREGNDGSGFISINAGVDPDRVTFFSVVDMRPAFSPVLDSDITLWTTATANINVGDIQPRLYIGVSGTLILRENGRASASPDNPIRLQYAGGYAARETLSLVMVVYSVDTGLSIYDNGVLVASEPTDKRPFTSAFGPGEHQFLRNWRGYAGLTGLINMDMAAPENDRYRRTLEQYLMGRYGIA